ncbi:MAG: GNAT family N-acetyltransferase [Streptosporangiaceae bacterium]
MLIEPMTAEFAADIGTWRYPPPYDYNDMTGSDPAFLADPASGFFALTDGGALIGFSSFGADGQVPGGDYCADALDTGGGLRPELTGQGLGRRAITTGLEFGRVRFSPAAFRVTVASGNARALRVVESLGFVRRSAFRSLAGGVSFEILVRPERGRPSSGRPEARAGRYPGS